MTVGSVVAREILIQLDNLTRTSVVQVAEVSLDVKMSAVGAFTVTKENIEDDRALLSKGVIGTGTEVNRTKREDLVILIGFTDRFMFHHLIISLEFMKSTRAMKTCESQWITKDQLIMNIILINMVPGEDKLQCSRLRSSQSWTTTSPPTPWTGTPSRSGTLTTGSDTTRTSSSRASRTGARRRTRGRRLSS